MPKKCDQLEVIEEEMPTICYEDIFQPGSGYIVYCPTVPAGYKLVVKKAGMEKARKTAHLEIGTNTNNPDIVIEGDVVYCEPNLEYSVGQTPCFHMVNRDTEKDKFMAWFMFDFVPV